MKCSLKIKFVVNLPNKFAIPFLPNIKSWLQLKFAVNVLNRLAVPEDCFSPKIKYNFEMKFAVNLLNRFYHQNEILPKTKTCSKSVK